MCLGTLQFLKPYVQKTNRGARPTDKISKRASRREYEQLSNSLSSALRCFEACGQYAWTLRAIDDWMDWSGTRPANDAVLAATRVLSATGLGQHAVHLVSSVLQTDPSPLQSSRNVDNVHSLYVASIATLHKNGLYDSADDLYMMAVSSGHLRWPLLQNCTDPRSLSLDLHGMTIATAHCAVRMSLQKEIQDANWNDTFAEAETEHRHVWLRDVIIITGRGKNSIRRFCPVLRPEVQRMLTEEFYPPLSTTSVPNNIGALKVPAEDIDAWLAFQRTQRGRRMLEVASILKHIGGGERLKRGVSMLNRGQEVGKGASRRVDV